MNKIEEIARDIAEIACVGFAAGVCLTVWACAFLSPLAIVYLTVKAVWG